MKLVQIHPEGFRETVLAVKEYRTYPPGFYLQTRWVLVLRPRRGPRHWELVSLEELVIEP